MGVRDAPARHARCVAALPSRNTEIVRSACASVPGPRRLFTSVLFPIATAIPAGNYDELFRESVDYDDGFAKAVYAAQPEQLDPMLEEADGTRPVQETGIQIGWDDEQVASMAESAGPAGRSRPGRAHGRLRLPGGLARTWWNTVHSLVRGRTALVVDGLDLGDYEASSGSRSRRTS